jgi:hypothetical protein
MLELLDSGSAPPWFRYPKDFLRVVRQNLIDLTPWYLMKRADVLVRMDGLRQRYPDRQLVPFARRDDNDDIACWAKNEGEKVFLIHDFASPGHEQRRVFPDFWSWFKTAIDEMIDFEP